MRLLVVAAIAGIAVLYGCSPLAYDDRCGPEVRVTTVAGWLPDSLSRNQVIGLIRVELQEERPDTILGRLVVYGDAAPGDSLGGPLRGHVLSAHLEDPAGTFAEVGPNPMGAGYFLGDPLIRIDAAELLERARAAFLDNTAVLVVVTDLPGRERLRAPLRLESVVGWARSHCS